MFVAAVAHIYSFPHHPFHINSPQYWNNPNHNWCRAFLSMIDISDMQEDVSEHFGVVSSSISRRFQGRTNYQPLSRGRRTSNESEYLINKYGVSTPQQMSSSTSAEIDTGNKQFNTNNANTVTNTNRYGATDNLVLPVCDTITADSQSQLAAATSSKASAVSSNFGINIQKREPHSSKDYPSQYGAPVAAGSNNFLLARNAGAGGGSPIPESNDDFASFIGSTR